LQKEFFNRLSGVYEIVSKQR